MSREVTKRLAVSKGAHYVAKKSPPQPIEHGNPPCEGKGQVKSNMKKNYTSYLAFVDDLKSRAPFTVLPASKITNYKDKEDLDNSYLNKARRKRQYDIAFTTIFKNHSCRIFAKCEQYVKLPVLYEIVQSLNVSYNALMTCKVDVEQAYETLIDSHAKKVKAGVDYDTGKVVNKRARIGQPPDTASSYTEQSDDEQRPDEVHDLETSIDKSEDDDKSTQALYERNQGMGVDVEKTSATYDFNEEKIEVIMIMTTSIYMILNCSFVEGQTDLLSH